MRWFALGTCGRVFAAWLVLSCASPAKAAGIEYALTPLGADKWQYDYTLVNPDGSLSFDEITVFFALPAVQSIASFAAPSGWDGIVAQPDSAIPADGFVDWLRAAGPVPSATRTSGFSVVFEVAGGALPAVQSFQLVNSNGPNGFEVVASGITSAVPEPGAVALMIPGVLVVGMVAGRRSSRRRQAPGACATPTERGAP